MYLKGAQRGAHSCHRAPGNPVVETSGPCTHQSPQEQNLSSIPQTVGPGGTADASVPRTGPEHTCATLQLSLYTCRSLLNVSGGSFTSSYHCSLDSPRRPGQKRDPRRPKSPSTLSILSLWTRKQGKHLPLKIFLSDSCFVPRSAVKRIPKSSWTTGSKGAAFLCPA